MMPIWFICWIIPVCVFAGICVAALLSEDDGYIPLGKQAWEAKLKAQYDDNADHFCPICGMHQLDVNMNRFASGVYFYVLEQGSKRMSKMMMLLK